MLYLGWCIGILGLLFRRGARRQGGALQRQHDSARQELAEQDQLLPQELVKRNRLASGDDAELVLDDKEHVPENEYGGQ